MHRPTTVILATAALTAAITAPALAQDATPMPAAEYRQALVDYEASAVEPEAEGFPTVAEILEGLDESAARYDSEYERLLSITPDPCYAEAHDTYLGYFDYGQRALPNLRPSLEQATTIFDVFPQLMAVAAEQEARFPAFYEFPDPDATPEPGVITIDFGQSGAEFYHLRAFDTLNTCEGMPEWEVPDPEAE